MSTQQFSDEMIKSLGKELESINNLIKSTEKILIDSIEKKPSEKKSEASTTPNKPTAEGDSAIVEEDTTKKSNVIFVDFKIANEFTQVANKPIKISKIIELYYDWSERVYALAKNNSSHLKNKKVYNHILKCHNLTKSVYKVVASL